MLPTVSSRHNLGNSLTSFERAPPSRENEDQCSQTSSHSEHHYVLLRERERERVCVCVCTCVCECILCKYVSVCQIIVHCATHVALLEELAISSNSTNTQCHVILQKKEQLIKAIILYQEYTLNTNTYIYTRWCHHYISSYIYSKCFHSSTSHTSIMHAACSSIMEWDRGGELWGESILACVSRVGIIEDPPINKN